MASYPMTNGSGGVGRASKPQLGQTPYAKSIAKSMTIDEMRQLHERALSEAEAKKTELRLVLASRYRELVGSSDEVLKMRERSQELHQLVSALPSLMTKLRDSTKLRGHNKSLLPAEADVSVPEDSSVTLLRVELARLPAFIHRSLDKNDVHGAATSLIDLFTLIASLTDEYMLANVLSKAEIGGTKNGISDPVVKAQTRMTFLHMQTLPQKALHLAQRALFQAAAYGQYEQDAHLGAQRSAAALSTLSLLNVSHHLSKTTSQDRAAKYVDLYFDSKAKLLHKLLNQLTTERSPGIPQNNGDSSKDVATKTASTAEAILSKIVLILQYDVVLHPFQIFVLRKFPCSDQTSSAISIMNSLPTFEQELLKAKASHFLAANLPLIRTKVKSVLVTIAGTTASALGKIRQSLYDKTDGVECMGRLDGNGICTWDEAVNGMVDVRVVLSHAPSFSVASLDQTRNGAPSPHGVGPQQRKFSLWSTLFSNIFSSLVHSLLTTSFHSVHAKVVSTLRTSLANAPPLNAILPHEAYRNTLRIATELDAALLKVSDDAHELLVHAEEREESEGRLRQSLYVQTCEIMGRLLSELRRMLLTSSNRESHTEGRSLSEATKQLIVGRLCHLLKFRLTSLPTLLDSNSSPAMFHAAAGTSSGMITLMELQSAFDLADDNEDGLITFDEAMEAVDSAFSGTQFRGAEMVRETLLLSSTSDKNPVVSTTAISATPRNVTLNELTLLSARGLRHEASGPSSALGTIQHALDDIVDSCFSEWAFVALQESSKTFAKGLRDFVSSASSTSENEWKRIHQPSAAAETNAMYQEIGESLPDNTLEDSKAVSSEPIIGTVSGYVVGYMLSVSSVLNRSTCPSDSLVPVPTPEYAARLGIATDGEGHVSNMMDTIRLALLRQALDFAAANVNVTVLQAMDERMNGDHGSGNHPQLKHSGPSASIQLAMDVSFLKVCFTRRNKYGFGVCRQDVEETVESSKVVLEKAADATDEIVGNVVDMDMVSMFQTIESNQRHVLEVCDLFLSSLLGDDTLSATKSVVAEDVNFATATGTEPLVHNPLPSSRRFVMLPVQSDRSLSELQLRGKLHRDKNQENKRDQDGFGVVSSGLGFFSSMLSKK